MGVSECFAGIVFTHQEYAVSHVVEQANSWNT